MLTILLKGGFLIYCVGFLGHSRIRLNNKMYNIFNVVKRGQIKPKQYLRVKPGVDNVQLVLRVLTLGFNG